MLAKSRPTPTLLTGYSLRRSISWTAKYRTVPMPKVNMATTMNERPRPLLKPSIVALDSVTSLNLSSCEIPTPTDAMDNDVRSHARNVLSEAKWSLATDPRFSNRSAPYWNHCVGLLTTGGFSTSGWLSPAVSTMGLCGLDLVHENKRGNHNG